MLINEVSIKNFKSLKDIHISTKRINLFIGEPNTGKSNLLEALSLFSENGIGRDLNKEAIRYNNVGSLFCDNDLSKKIEISTDILRLEIEFLTNLPLFEKDKFLFNYDYKNRTHLVVNHEVPEWIHNEVDYNLEGKEIKQGGPIYPSPFRTYLFKRLEAFTSKRAKRLDDPFGENVLFLLETSPDLTNVVSSFFKEGNYYLNFRPVADSIEVAKNIKGRLISYPYHTISETLQRIVFISLAIATNKDSILIFDEPESNTFPFYTKYIAEVIANDKSNQYFLTTHNPFFLSNLVEKTPADEIAVFVAANEDYQTKLYPLDKLKMEELVTLGHDVFFNLDKLTGK